VALLIKLRTASQLGNGGGVAPATINEIADGLEQAIDELRDVARGIYPTALIAGGIVAALNEVRRRAATPIALDCTGIRRYRPALESAVYYCCLEAIQNATKHGGPSVHISIVLQQEPDQLRFEVSDDGYGFNAGHAGWGTGLQNMHDRIEAVDGALSVASTAGSGAVVSGSVPVPTPVAAQA
jgi:signal transduction histidine kinase